MVIEPNGRAKKRTRVDCGSTLDLCRESRSPPWGTAAPGWIVAASPGHPSGTGRRPAGSARFRAGRDFFSAESARFVPGGIFSQPGRRGSRREGFFLSRVVAISCREGFFLSRVVAISRREGFFLSRVVAISRRVGSFLSRVVTISRRVGSFLSRVVAVRAGWDRFSAGSSRFRAGWSLAQPGRRGPRRVVSRSAGSSRSAPGGLSLSRVVAVRAGWSLSQPGRRGRAGWESVLGADRGMHFSEQRLRNEDFEYPDLLGAAYESRSSCRRGSWSTSSSTSWCT